MNIASPTRGAARTETTRARESRGWTLIELIGALAIVALMMGLVAPALQRRLEDAARARERLALSELSRGAREQFRRTGSFPDAGTLPNWLSIGVGWRSTDVLTNGRSLRRALLIDPGWIAGPPPGSGVPFIQGPSGNLEPQHLRCILISTLGEPLPNELLSGIGLTSERFEALWSTAPGSIPAGWVWSGLASDLFIERLDFYDEFVPTLIDTAASGQGRIAIGTNVWVPEGGRLERWYLKGTPLRLCGGSGELQALEVVSSHAGWKYWRGKWRRYGAGNLPENLPTGRDFGELAESLLTMGTPPSGDATAPARLIAAIRAFQSAYSDWGNAGFPTPLAESSVPVIAWRELESATTALLGASEGNLP